MSSGFRTARARTGLVVRQMLVERARSTLWWSVGLGLVVALIVASFPAVADSAEAMEAFVEQLPEGMAAALGLSGTSIAEPAGYLTSQLYANLYSIVLLVLAIGLGAWCVAGSESDHTLELLLASPISRAAAAVERFVGLALIVASVAAASTAVLAALSPTVDLDAGLPWWGVWSAGLGAWALAVLHGAVAFAVGAATGSRAFALAAGSAVAVVGFLGFAVSGLSDALSWMGEVSPWQWYVDSQPLSGGPTSSSLGLPLLITTLLVAAGVLVLDRRDLR